MNAGLDLPLTLLPDRYAVCRLAAGAPQPDWLSQGDLAAVVRTPDELSVVCAERIVPPEVKAERGWRAFQVQGPLDFSLVGVLASIAAPLAEAGGGTERCNKSTYKNCDDADYQSVLQLVEAAVEKAWKYPRRDLKAIRRQTVTMRTSL